MTAPRWIRERPKRWYMTPHFHSQKCTQFHFCFSFELLYLFVFQSKIDKTISWPFNPWLELIHVSDLDVLPCQNSISFPTRARSWTVRTTWLGECGWTSSMFHLLGPAACSGPFYPEKISKKYTASAQVVCIFPFIAKISSGEGELIHLTQGKSAARKVVWDHTRLPALLARTSRDGRHRVKVWCTEPLFTNLSNHIEKLSGKCCAVTHFGILFIFSYFHNTTAGEMMEQCFRVKISDLPPTEDSNLLLSVQLETEDPGQKSNKRKKTELYCNLLHLNDTNDMEVPF